MTETGPVVRSFVASDGYPLHVAIWPAVEPARGQIVVLHGVQSHGGWYHRLGRSLAAGRLCRLISRPAGFRRQSARSRPRSIGAATDSRPGRVAAETLRRQHPGLPIALAGISWGGKLAVTPRRGIPSWSMRSLLICPGLHPRVGVSRKERLEIAWAFLTNRRKTFPIPLSDPALFTANPEGQAFIAADPFSLREGTAGLLAASFIIDRLVARAPAPNPSAGLADAGGSGSNRRQ